jgi:signal peptidase I
MKQAGAGCEDSAVAVKCDLASEVLRSFGSLRFAATGWSMLPSIWPGDTLVVDRVEPHQISLGDVVLVGRGGRLCAHRVVGKAKSGEPQWITRGDAMSAPDRAVAESEILGRVTYVIRSGKLIAVPAELSVAERVTAKIVQHSVPAARALVFLHRMANTSKKSAAKESSPCQG